MGMCVRVCLCVCDAACVDLRDKLPRSCAVWRCEILKVRGKKICDGDNVASRRKSVHLRATKLLSVDVEPIKLHSLRRY
jgi:hypothetical protein